MNISADFEQYNNIADEIFITSSDGRILFVNEIAHKNIIKLQESELVNIQDHYYWQYFDESELEYIRRFLRVNDNNVNEIECYFQFNGENKILIVSQNWEEKNVKYLFKLKSVKSNDLIISQVISQNNYQKNNELESLIISEKGIIKSLNEEAIKEFGYSLIEIQAINPISLIQKDFQNDFSNFIEEKHNGSFQTIAQRKDESVFNCRIQTQLYTIDNKEIRITQFKNLDNQKSSKNVNEVYLKYLESIERINQVIKKSKNLDEVNQNLMELLLSIFQCDRAYLLHPCDLEAKSFQIKYEKTTPAYPGALTLNAELKMTPEMEKIFKRVLNSDEPVTYFYDTPDKHSRNLSSRFSVMSAMFMPIFPMRGKPWQLGLHQCSYKRIWTTDEVILFKEISVRLTETINNLLFTEELISSENQYKYLVETAHEGIVLINKDGIIDFVNDQISQMTEYEKQELIGQSIFHFLGEKEKLLGAEQLQMRLKGLNSKYEINLISKNGKLLELYVSSSPWIKDNIIYGARLMIINRTELKDITLSLEQSEAKYQKIVETTTEGILLIDKFGIIRFANERFAEFFELKDKNLTQISLFEFIPEDSYLMMLNALNQMHETRHILWEFEINKVGEPNKTFLSSCSYTADQNQVLLMLTDISIRKNIEREKEKITQDLVRRNHNLEQFAYIISHNLRAPVSNILSTHSILQDPKRNISEDSELVEMIHRSVVILDDVITDLNDILQIGKNIEHNREAIEIKTLIDNVKTSLSGKIIKEAAIIDTEFNGIQFIYTIRSFYYSIIHNLLSNALKYRNPQIVPSILISFKKSESNVILTIKDNGVGIDLTRHKKNLFGLYQRFHKNIEGTGLGLFMVKTQVEALGGTIDVVSKPYEGTTFIVSIPKDVY